MKNRLLSVILVLTMSFAMVACGANNAEVSTETDVNADTSADLDTDVNTNVDDADSDNSGDINEDADIITDVADGTVGQKVYSVFLAEATKDGVSAEDIANNILESDAIDFGGATMQVEEGLLTGFSNAEITGFKEGVMFAPMIGSIPFIGYIFTIEEGADIDAFMSLLKENADPRWNVCTEADETVIEKSGDKVFFLMCPKSFEE